MAPVPCHDLSPLEIDAIEERLYEFNRSATGRDDAAAMCFAIYDEVGAMMAAATGHTWAGIAEIKQMWVDDRHRGKGHGRALLGSMIEEARRRGVNRIWVASYNFQAPQLYERFGFVRVAELAGWPTGHTQVILSKSLV